MGNYTLFNKPETDERAARAAVEATWPARKTSIWRGDGRIVTLPDGTMPAPWVCRNALNRSRKASGLPHIRQHDMRHLHASLLLAEGLPLTVVSARLGHGSPAITAAIYSHALRGHDGAAAVAIEAALQARGASR